MDARERSIAWFQSLIGILQTKNSLIFFFAITQFQSLIGILQTKSTYIAKVNGKEFQSLIGILQTIIPWDIEELYNQFQSLIGILQTGSYANYFYSCYYVSIPHRYSTNQQNHNQIPSKLQRFNPSQVFYKLGRVELQPKIS